MNDNDGDIHTRDDIEDDLLVADYVAGKLDDEAQAAFEARLKDDDDLLARVIEERGFRSQQDESNDESDGPEVLQDAAIVPPGDEPVKRASPWRRGAIAAVLIAAAIVVFYNQSARQETPQAEVEFVPVLESNYVRIIFSSDASESDRSDVASALGVEITYGPVDVDSYIGEGDGVVTREDLESWLNDPRVTLVEPVRIQHVP